MIVLFYPSKQPKNIFRFQSIYLLIVSNSVHSIQFINKNRFYFPFLMFGFWSFEAINAFHLRWCVCFFWSHLYKFDWQLYRRMHRSANEFDTWEIKSKRNEIVILWRQFDRKMKSFNRHCIYINDENWIKKQRD